MTRKDYVIIAQVIADAKYSHTGNDFDRGWHAAQKEIADGMARALASDNPRFDRERFLTACGVNDND